MANYLTMQAQDNRMNETQLFKGTWLKVQLQKEVQETDVAACLIPGDQVRFCHMITGQNFVVLVPHSTDPAYTPEVFLKSDVTLLGRVAFVSGSDPAEEDNITPCGGADPRAIPGLSYVGMMRNPLAAGAPEIPLYEMGGTEDGGINTLEGWNGQKGAQLEAGRLTASEHD